MGIGKTMHRATAACVLPRFRDRSMAHRNVQCSDGRSLVCRLLLVAVGRACRREPRADRRGVARATDDLSGTAEIAWKHALSRTRATTSSRIAGANAFVADVTIGFETPTHGRLPNPNVLVELR
jgi:hypothetical protein